MRCLMIAAVLLALPAGAGAFAQSPAVPHIMQHGSAPMDHGAMKDRAPAAVPDGSARSPIEPGQAAFAAIQEIVGILDSDPATDWSKVDIEALRQHLIDMDNVTLRAQVASEPIEGGMRFTVTGEGPVEASIRRMVAAHAATMDGVDGWHFSATEVPHGATLTVLPPPGELPRLKGLGFIGVMARGMHHQAHHLLLARGEHPHGG